MNFPFELQKDKPLRETNEECRRGYRMITAFDIANFRCFEQLSLKDLSTVNIVVGDNGSGKTALIEALLLAAYAHPRAITWIRELRRRPLPQDQVSWSSGFFQSLWEDLFYNFQDSKIIKARFTDSLVGERKVVVSYVWPESGSALSVGGPIPYLVVQRFGSEQPDGAETTISTALLKINEQGAPVTEGASIASPPVYFLPSTTQFLPEDMVTYFGEVSKRNLEDYLIETLQKDFPEILNISILPDGGVSGLFVRVESIPNKKMPLAIVSAGIARYLNILMAVIMTEKGVVLVDEIENGIYWAKMPNIWKRLRDLCKERGVQLFATTHSDECLQSLIAAIQGHESDFSLLRAAVTNGEHSVKQIGGEIFLAALEQHGEIR